jgi:hypothetical protein
MTADSNRILARHDRMTSTLLEAAALRLNGEEPLGAAILDADVEGGAPNDLLALPRGMHGAELTTQEDPIRTSDVL